MEFAEVGNLRARFKDAIATEKHLPVKWQGAICQLFHPLKAALCSVRPDVSSPALCACCQRGAGRTPSLQRYIVLKEQCGI